MTATLGETLAPYLTEAQMQDAIRTAALRNGWLFYHTHNSRRSDAGFPDCVCVKDGRMIVFELKKQSGRVEPKQRAWVNRFADVPNCTAAIVRPIPKAGEISYDQALEMFQEDGEQ